MIQRCASIILAVFALAVSCPCFAEVSQENEAEDRDFYGYEDMIAQKRAFFIFQCVPADDPRYKQLLVIPLGETAGRWNMIGFEKKGMSISTGGVFEFRNGQWGNPDFLGGAKTQETNWKYVQELLRRAKFDLLAADQFEKALKAVPPACPADL